jgi:hypothetical protein
MLIGASSRWRLLSQHLFRLSNSISGDLGTEQTFQIGDRHSFSAGQL